MYYTRENCFLKFTYQGPLFVPVWISWRGIGTLHSFLYHLPHHKLHLSEDIANNKVVATMHSAWNWSWLLIDLGQVYMYDTQLLFTEGVVSSYMESRNTIYDDMLPNLSPSPNLYKVQSVY